MVFSNLLFRLNFFDVLIITILLFILTLRVNYIDPYLNTFTDHARDYLVARHIVKYGELVQIGPHNSIFKYFSSPAYFYFLALFLAIKDDILTLQILNCFLQVINIAILYFFTKKLFSQGTALIATLLLINQYTLQVIKIDFFQPYMMTPFISLTYLFLAQAYTRSSFLLLLLGTIFFAFAGTLHNSAFGLLPMLLVISYLVTKTIKQGVNIFRYYFYFLITLIGSVLILYLPTILYFVSHQHDFFKMAIVRLATPPVQFFPNLINSFTTFLNLSLFKEETPTLVNDVILLLIIIGGVMYLLSAKVNPKKKAIITILMLSIITYILLFSFVGVDSLKPYYFAPIFILFLIFISELANNILSGSLFLKVSKIILIISLFFILGSNIHLLRFQTNSEWLDRASGNITSTINSIKEREGRNDIRFFQIRGYLEHHFETPYQLFNILERKYNQRFIQVDSPGLGYHKFKDLNTDDYILFYCDLPEMGNYSPEQCINDFSRVYHPKYSLITEVYSELNHHIYLFRRNNFQ